MPESKSDFGGTVKARKAASRTTPKADKSSGKKPEAPEQLVPLHVFGSNGADVRDSVSYFSEDTLCHLAGRYLCIYNTAQKKMVYFGKSKNSRNVLGMAVAPVAKYIALCEESVHEDKAQVSVYHITRDQWRHRTLTYPMKGDFSLCAFAPDTRILATYGTSTNSAGDTEAQIVYWKWTVDKVLCTTKQPFKATRIRICPTDASLITTSGPSHLRLWRATMDPLLKETVLLQGQREKENFVDHIWLAPPKSNPDQPASILAVTEGGLLLLFTGAVTDDGVPTYELRDKQWEVPLPESARGARVESLTASEKGFCVGGNRGFFAVYERTDDPKDPFLLLKTFSGGDEIITSMSVSPNDEKLVANSRPGRLRVFPLANIDMLSEGKDHFAPLTQQGAHVDQVAAMDVCVQLPLIVTASSDKTVRVWNYLTWECQMTQALDEVPQTVAFHPSGFFVLVGFRERLRAYNLLMDGLKLYQPNQKDLQVKNCKAVSFSTGGQFFACGAGIKVVVYASYSFEEVMAFEGHVSVPIRQLVWSNDDRYLCSCGDDGAVYTCSMDDGSRIEPMSFVNKQAQYSSVAITNDKSTVVGAGSDGFLRVTHANGEEEQHNCGLVVTSLLLSKDNQKLYAGTSTGLVRVYQWPIAKPGKGKPLPGGGGGAPVEAPAGAGTGAGAGGSQKVPPPVDTSPITPAAPPFVDYHMHSGAITSLHMSRDGKYLFTGSVDGCMFVLGIPKPLIDGVAPPSTKHRRSKSRRKEALVDRVDKRQFNLGVTLVNEEVIKEKLADLAAMEKKLEETNQQAKYNLHLKDSEWAEKLAKQAEARDEAMEEEKQRYEDLQQRHEAYIRDHMEEKERSDAEHVRIVQEVENQYEHKLALELERYDALSEQVESMRQECEILLDSAEQAHNAALRDREQQFSEREAELQQEVQQLKQTMQTNHLKFETILQGVEEEHEQEILARKDREREAVANVEQLVGSKQEDLIYEQNQNDQLNKRNKALMTDMLEKEKILDAATTKNERLTELLAHANRVIEEQRKSIADKEKQILNLRAGNRTLDNFRFVLDHRINQLTQERGPITAHVDDLEGHIREMYDELVREFHEKKATDREMSNKDLKIEGLTREAVKLRASVREKERVISSIQADLERHVKTTEIKHLEGALKDMYKTYVKNEKPSSRARSHSTSSGSGRGDASNAPVSSAQASEAVQEVLRQKEYMERHAKGLKRKLNTRMMQQKAASRARLAENASLINECNDLRKDNVRFRRKIKELETSVYLLTRDAGSGTLPDATLPSAGVTMSSTGRTDTMGTRRLPSPSPSPADHAGSRMGTPMTEGSRRSRGSAGGSRPRSRGRRKGGDPGNDALKNLVKTGSSMQRSRSEVVRGSKKSGGGKGYGLWSNTSPQQQSSPHLGMRNSASAGRIVRGSTKQLDELTNVRVKMSELLGQIDDNNREMSMQRREIKRLRDQVRMLATSQPGRAPVIPPAGGFDRAPPLGPQLSKAGDIPPMAVNGLPVSPLGSPGRNGARSVSPPPQMKGTLQIGVPTVTGAGADSLTSAPPSLDAPSGPTDNKDVPSTQHGPGPTLDM